MFPSAAGGWGGGIETEVVSGDARAGVPETGEPVSSPGVAIGGVGIDTGFMGNEAEAGDCWVVPGAAIREFSPGESSFFFRKQKHMAEIEYRYVSGGVYRRSSG